MWFNRNRIYFSYNPNGGTVKKTTKSKDGNTTYKWSVTDNLIYRSTNGGTASQLKTNIKYGATTLNLNDYNYEYYLNITKSGYSGKSGEEWLCSSGCKTSNMKFSQAKMTVKTNSCGNSVLATILYTKATIIPTAKKARLIILNFFLVAERMPFVLL